MSRAPRAFCLDPSVNRTAESRPGADESARETQLDRDTVLVEEPDPPYDEATSIAPARKARAPWLGVLGSAGGGLLLLWIGLRVGRIGAQPLVTTPALGWTALALAVIALVALIAVLARELRGVLREKRIAAVPDWKKVLRPEFMEKARASA